jgi:hypothetical protein
MGGCFIGPSSSGPLTWQECDFGYCSVMLPHTPITENGKSVPKTFLWSSGEFYLVDFFEGRNMVRPEPLHEKKNVTVDDLLMAIQVGKQNSPFLSDAIVERKAKIIVQGKYPGIELEGHKDNTMQVRSWLILGPEGKVYWLIYGNETTLTGPKAGSDKFFQSFKIKPFVLAL